MKYPLEDAMMAAQVFLDRCVEIRTEELRAAKARADGDDWVQPSRVHFAAAKRASMDLTRALAQFRKPGAI